MSTIQYRVRAHYGRATKEALFDDEPSAWANFEDLARQVSPGLTKIVMDRMTRDIVRVWTSPSEKNLGLIQGRSS